MSDEVEIFSLDVSPSQLTTLYSKKIFSLTKTCTCIYTMRESERIEWEIEEWKEKGSGQYMSPLPNIRIVQSSFVVENRYFCRNSTPFKSRNTKFWLQFESIAALIIFT